MREQGAERLLKLMSQLPDDLLEEAVSYQRPVSRIAPRMMLWSKGALVAACLCVCLIGGLAWSNSLQNSMGETGGAGNTGAGVAAGGAFGEQAVKPTLAPPTEQTGARPIDSTDETPMASTEATPESGSGTVGMMVSEFRYKGQLYVDTGIVLEELPESCQLQGTLAGNGLATEAEWITQDPALVGAKVYHMAGDDTGFYVETAGGYRYYGKGSAAE